jgi:hypothetical protein
VSRGEGLTHKAFRALFARYRESGQTAQRRALAPHYRAFLRQSLEAARLASAAFALVQSQMVQQGAEPQAAAALQSQMGIPPDTLKKMQAELDEISTFVATSDAARDE